MAGGAPVGCGPPDRIHFRLITPDNRAFSGMPEAGPRQNRQAPGHHFDHRHERLATEFNRPLPGGGIRAHIHGGVFQSLFVQPVLGVHAPAAHGAGVERDPLRLFDKIHPLHLVHPAGRVRRKTPICRPANFQKSICRPVKRHLLFLQATSPLQEKVLRLLTGLLEAPSKRK